MTAQKNKSKRERLARALIFIGALVPWAAVITGISFTVYRIENPGAGLTQDTALIGVWIFIGMMLLGETGHSIRKAEEKKAKAAQEAEVEEDQIIAPAHQTARSTNRTRFVR